MRRGERHLSLSMARLEPGLPTPVLLAAARPDLLGQLHPRRASTLPDRP